jgi:hypothetical protein
VFVLCSPSSAARRYWRLDSWHELADWLRATRPRRFESARGEALQQICNGFRATAPRRQSARGLVGGGDAS